MADNVVNGGWVAKPRPESVAEGGGGPYDPDMEARLIKLEEFADDAKQRLTRIEATVATKSDVGDLKSFVHVEMHQMIRWMVGTAVGLGVAAITVMTFVLNNAVPKAPSSPTTAPAPIIFTVPAAPAPAAPPTK